MPFLGTAPVQAQGRRGASYHHNRNGEGVDADRQREQVLGADLRERVEADSVPERDQLELLCAEPANGVDRLRQVLADLRCRLDYTKLNDFLNSP